MVCRRHRTRLCSGSVYKSTAQVAPGARVPKVTPGGGLVLTYCMHEAKGLAAFFAPIQTFSKVCGALYVPELPRLLLLLQYGKEQRCFDGRAGQQHIAPGSCLLGLVKGYTIQWRV